MEMTRQRVRPSLLYTFSEPCPVCGGVGMVQGRDTTVTKIERWLKRAEVKNPEKKLTLYVHPTVFDYLIDDSEERLKQLNGVTATTLELIADNHLSIEQFRFFSHKTNKDITELYSV